MRVLFGIASLILLLGAPRLLCAQETVSREQFTPQQLASLQANGVDPTGVASATIDSAGNIQSYQPIGSSGPGISLAAAGEISTIAAETLSPQPSVSGDLTGSVTAAGNSVFGTASGDTLTLAPPGETGMGKDNYGFKSTTGSAPGQPLNFDEAKGVIDRSKAAGSISENGNVTDNPFVVLVAYCLHYLRYLFASISVITGVVTILQLMHSGDMGQFSAKCLPWAVGCGLGVILTWLAW